MSECDEHCVQLALYLDGELDDHEKRAFEAHIRNCLACRNRFNRERRFLGHLQRTAPLHTTPKELRSQITSLICETPLDSNLGQARKSLLVPPTRLSKVRLITKHFHIAAVLTSLLVIAGLWGAAQIINPSQSLTFAAIAVDAHHRYSLGRLPLEMSSDSPSKISRWFDGKVAFSLKLPNYQEISGQENLYSLKGARLIGFEKDYVAYVAYEMGQHPISLVVTSSDKTKPEGGEQIPSKGLVFHYETIAGLNVITWVHRGLTYALVSDLDERGQQSCLVCHQGAKDENIIGNLDAIGPTVIAR